MIHEAKATGATIEEALANAKAALNAPETADVRTEIISLPQKKVLGLFGGKKAEARAFYETPDAPAPKKQPAAPKAEPKAQKPQKPAQKNASKPSSPKEEIKEAKPEKKVEAKAEAAPEIPRTEISIDSKPGVKAAAEYLVSVIKLMGVEKAEVKAFVQADNEVLLELDCGEDYGIVIGRRGETLDSIQYLTRLVANKNKKENEYSRISVNVGNYREKRKNTLANLAKKNSEKVLKYGRNFTFEPMNPYERRIIHTTVQEIEGVTSHSVGSDDERRVVITLAEGVKPTHPSRGGRNNRGSRGPRQGGSRGNSQKVESPQRAPKTDAGAAGVSLYGKIN